MKQTAVLCALLLCISSPTLAQEEDMMKLLGEEPPKKEKVYNAFKSSRVIMSHSMEMLRPGVLDFRILHRFGRINSGLHEFFGLDGPATVRLGLDYGLTNFLTIGLGRSTNRKELDGFIKWRPLHQSKGTKSFPISVVAVGGTVMHTLPWADTSRKNFFSSRLAYYGQLIIGRKFSDRLTLQLMPTIVHQNLVTEVTDKNDVYAAGIGGRIKLSKRTALTFDYYYVVNPNNAASRYHPVSIGFDIETGGHVFQLHFTNARGMNERAFINDTDFNWGNGDILFGFNISRSFQIGHKKK